MPWWLTLTQQSAVGFFHPGWEGCLRSLCWVTVKESKRWHGSCSEESTRLLGKKKIPFTSFYWLQGPREPCRTSVGCGIMTKQFSVLSDTRIAKKGEKKKRLTAVSLKGCNWRRRWSSKQRDNPKTIRKCTVLTKSFSQLQAQRKKVLRGAANSKHAKEEPELHLWLL